MLKGILLTVKRTLFTVKLRLRGKPWKTSLRVKFANNFPLLLTGIYWTNFTSRAYILKGLKNGLVWSWVHKGEVGIVGANLDRYM